MNETILIVEDEPDMIEFIKDSLEDDGYKVLYAYNGKQALEIISKNKEIDLILLDIMMPEIDGFSFCSKVRDDVDCPIIFVTAIGNEAEKLQGFAVGGDDYIVKPFSLKELKARIEAHIRRQKRNTTSKSTYLGFGELKVDLRGKSVIYKNEEIQFTLKEFELIEFLALNAGQVFSKEKIYEHVWGTDSEGDVGTVSEHVKRIRSKLLSKDPELNIITTVWGVGYKWEKEIR